MELISNTILIIEDDAGLSELLAEKVDECGYQSVCVQSGGAALDWLKEHTPFLIILDYRLPDMNGKEFIKVMNQKWFTLNRIIHTPRTLRQSTRE